MTGNDQRQHQSGVTLAVATTPQQFHFEPYVDADVLAQFTGYDRRTLLRWTREGKIPGYPPPGGKKLRNNWRYKLSEVDAAIRSNIESPCRPCRPQKGRLQ
jgi:hypothetical protein